jgi:dipeptidyl-peptidase 4
VVHLINNTDSKYPALIPIHYPKTGDQNSTVRIGLISAAGEESTTPFWIPIPTDGEGYHSNSNAYLADLTFHEPTGQVLIQQINRLQNHLTVWCFDPTTGGLRIVFEDRDEAWIDILHETHWVDDGQSFLFISDRKGWKQIYLVKLQQSEEEGAPLALTPTGVDVESIQGISQAAGCVYFIASPDDPLRRYLYRAAFDGSAISRVTPTSAEFLGTNAYSVSSDGNYAIHTFSAAHCPPAFRYPYSALSLSSCPQHRQPPRPSSPHCPRLQQRLAR